MALALNSLQRVDMPLNKEKPNRIQTQNKENHPPSAIRSWSRRKNKCRVNKKKDMTEKTTTLPSLKTGKISW